MSIPANLKYTPEHEWLEIDGDQATVGITAFAADALGDVVFVELPPVGATVATGDVCGEIESTKSVSEIYAPADGLITEINQAVIENPDVLNEEAYQHGWLFRMTITKLPPLLDATAYDRIINGG
jgi:glycine cleavage system H protein